MPPRWSWGPMAIGGTKEEGAEGQTGASGGRAERLAVFRRGGEIRKTGEIIGDTGDLELGTRIILFQILTVSYRGQL